MLGTLAIKKDQTNGTDFYTTFSWLSVDGDSLRRSTVVRPTTARGLNAE
jgi:hypothetical protein